MTLEEQLEYLRLKVKDLESRLSRLESATSTFNASPVHEPSMLPIMMMMSLTNPAAGAIYRTLKNNPITSQYLAHPLSKNLFDPEKLKKDFGSTEQFLDKDGDEVWPSIVNCLIHSKVEKDLMPPDDPKIVELKKLVEAMPKKEEDEE